MNRDNVQDINHSENWKMRLNINKDVCRDLIEEISRMNSKAFNLLILLLTIVGITTSGIYWAFSHDIFHITFDENFVGLLILMGSFFALAAALWYVYHAIPTTLLGMGPNPKNIQQLDIDFNNEELLKQTSKTYAISATINWYQALRSRYDFDNALFYLYIFVLLASVSSFLLAIKIEHSFWDKVLVVIGLIILTIFVYGIAVRRFNKQIEKILNQIYWLENQITDIMEINSSELAEIKNMFLATGLLKPSQRFKFLFSLETKKIDKENIEKPDVGTIILTEAIFHEYPFTEDIIKDIKSKRKP